MFSDIKNGWKKDDLLKQASQETEKMLVKNEKIFRSVTDSLITGKKPSMNVYREDDRTNLYDMEIRKKILQHLSLNPKQDVKSSMILIGVSRDVERIGDFSKNILELYIMFQKKFPKDKYFKDLIEARNMVLENFKRTRKAFMESDKKLAEEAMNTHHKKIKVGLDNMLGKIMNDDKINSQDAVTCVLFSRYLKRVSAHLMNIASAVANPFHRIRYKAYDGHVELKGMK